MRGETLEGQGEEKLTATIAMFLILTVIFVYDIKFLELRSNCLNDVLHRATGRGVN